MTIAFMYDIKPPHEDLLPEDFPLISNYVFVKAEDAHGSVFWLLYVPEDNHLITDPLEQLEFIHRMAPYATFHGAVDADVGFISGPEDD